MAEAEKAVLHQETERAHHHAPPAEPSRSFGVADLVLRFLFFALALVAVVVMATSKQTKTIFVQVPSLPGPVPVTRSGKFNQSSALIYFMAALSVAAFYGIITTILTFFALTKRKTPTKLLAHLIILDVLLLGIVASATGTAGADAYIGLKGNSHAGWNKICNQFDKFCRHIASSAALALVASIVLVLLILLNVYALSKKIPK